MHPESFFRKQCSRQRLSELQTCLRCYEQLFSISFLHIGRCFKDTGYTVCRQGMGVTGGEPLGFNIGAQGPGGTLPGLDLVTTYL